MLTVCLISSCNEDLPSFCPPVRPPECKKRSSSAHFQHTTKPDPRAQTRSPEPMNFQVFEKAQCSL